MTHQRIKSSNLYSLAHDGENMEVRFLCQACKGSGDATITSLSLIGTRERGKCSNCRGVGHTGTYRGKVPIELFRQVTADKSVGQAFNRVIRGNASIKLEKMQ